MQNENKLKLILAIVAIVVVVIVVSNVLHIRIRSAKYLVYAVVCLGLYFASVVRNKKQ